MDEKFRSRKWRLTLLVQGSAIVGLMTGYLNGADFAIISSATIASYNLANAAQYIAER